MIPVARRLLFANRGGLLVTVAGVGATVALLLFLFMVHDGVRDGSTGYVRTADVDLWIGQKNSDNILKSSSYLPAAVAERVRRVEGVRDAAPLVRVFSKADIDGRRSSTLFILGFDPVTRLGEPKTVVQGTTILRPGDLILDRSFALTYKLALGDRLDIQGRRFRVAGISKNTNPLVSQFAFLRLDDASALLGLEGTASFIVVRVSGNRAAVAARLRQELPELSVYEADEFLRHHVEEMESGILPVFASAAVFGAVVCGFIVALMLYNSILQRREEYATLKALGASQRYLLRLVAGQALLVTTLGCAAGAALAGIVTPLLLRFVPSLAISWNPLLFLVLPAALLVGAVSAAVPVRMLRRIYPAEVFRA
ncbi:MAG TPA: ABC transporter permease [Thermoanaerobaculia bacterium]|nr:ABC transporter permease [Thermoanaerobaculia bacterium]